MAQHPGRSRGGQIWRQSRDEIDAEIAAADNASASAEAAWQVQQQLIA
jgi:hypothetical protein